MFAVYFLLGGNKVFHFCHAVIVCVGMFFAVAVVRGTRMTLIVVVRLIVVLRSHAHHRAMVMVRHSGKRQQQEGGNRYGQYGKLTFQC